MERHGFYPRGGGRIVIEFVPAGLTPAELTDRGAPRSNSAEAIVAGIPSDIAERELKAMRKVLLEWSQEAFTTRTYPPSKVPETRSSSPLLSSM